MTYDHKAIYKSHTNVVRIVDGENCYDASGNVVTLNQSNIDAARVELDKTKYQTDRVSLGSTVHYPDISTQLDQLYHDMADGKLGVGATTGSWFVGITTVKTTHPKPS
tara:strand:- start:95 stop:418 length:324 start_codon:yes stop_codon:yes gene_type:complete